MKIGKKLCIITVISLLFAFIFPGITHAASSGDYALMIGDEDSEYTLYEDEIVLTSTKEIMLKASSVCELLGFSYSYDKSTKKLTIKNKSNGKYLVFTNGSKEYTIPISTAGNEYNNFNGSSVSPIPIRSLSSKPLLLKMIIQPYIRIKAFVQKGTITRIIITFFALAESLAIKYPKGYPASKVIRVVSKASFRDSINVLK